MLSNKFTFSNVILIELNILFRYLIKKSTLMNDVELTFDDELRGQEAVCLRLVACPTASSREFQMRRLKYLIVGRVFFVNENKMDSKSKRNNA